MSVPTTRGSDIHVWRWLAGRTEPVPLGALRVDGPQELHFAYRSDYLSRSDATSISPDLPLREGWFAPAEYMSAPGAIRDAAPDSWGRRVTLNALTGRSDREVDVDFLPESTYLLESGSNRFGSLDFQSSDTMYSARDTTVDLSVLQQAAILIESGEALAPHLTTLVGRKAPVGGARPKAIITDEDGKQYIAKFSSSTDPMPVVESEAACLYLARHAGIDTPNTKVVRSLGKNVVLVERFDRGPGGTRIQALSALTLTGLSEVEARYGSYPEFLDVLTTHSADEGVGRELFARVAFNIATSNTDDHLRNHAAFWDGQRLQLTPAYDLSPMMRSGDTASQAIAYGRDGERDSSFAGLIDTCSAYGLSRNEAIESVDRMKGAVSDNWENAADFARLSSSDRKLLYGRQILHPAASYGMPQRVFAPYMRTKPSFSHRRANECGAPTLKGTACQRHGQCPYH